MASIHLTLRVSERDGRIRLSLGGFSCAEGETLQEAADQLVYRMLEIAMAFRNGGVGRLSSECGLDVAVMDFIWQLGEVAASGGDVREFLLGPSALAA
jgi:hypothetical protein